MTLLTPLLAAYTCTTCQVTGRVLKNDAGQALCWYCGQPAVITAIVAGVKDFSLLRAAWTRHNLNPG